MSCLHPRQQLIMIIVAGGLLFMFNGSALSQTVPYQSWQWPDRELPAVLVDTVDVEVDDEWLGRDKAMHAGISFLMTLSAQYVYENNIGLKRNEALPLSIATSLSAGLAKELMDANREVNPHFSTKDLIADLIGALVAVGLIAL